MGIRAGLVATVVVCAFACGNKNGAKNDAPGGDGDAPLGPDAALCHQFGDHCTGNADCCSNLCNATGTCDFKQTCGGSGSACTVNTDCCAVSCVGSQCRSTCTADNQTCSVDGECCSGKCNGTCAPLNPSCKTDGNPCTSANDCCSSLCTPSGTCGNASYCVQNGDACSKDGDCCGGICTKSGGAMLGTCSQPSTGATNCSAGVDGTLCSGCGDCCSRLCEVYPPTGVKICQPAEGCRIDGDLCYQDSDCCGATGSGLPGAGNVVCLRQNAGDPVGVCRNPVGCDPEGDVCHYKDYSTCGNSSARNDCCGAPGNSGVCELDSLGVPRCYGITACVDSGAHCAFSGDCCNGLPCVPDGTGNFVCGQSACQMNGQTCTNSSDCCNGTTCVFVPGMPYGTCGGMTTCALDGQSCSDTNPCCDGNCNVTGTGTACPAGMETGCTCFTPIF
jgi:hypothetical protein